MKTTLKIARLNAGYETQEEAAKVIGISKYTVSNHERGKSFPDVPTLKKYEKTYKIKYDDIIFLHENND